jgi:hypothetical protein
MPSSSTQPQKKLTKLIGKAAWKNVLESITSDPEQAKEPIPMTWSPSTVYPLHQAVSRSSTKPIPPSVLKALINCNPEALDYYVFLGASENKRAHIDVIETLFSEASIEILLTVQTHAYELSLAALGNDNSDIVGMFCDRYPHLLKGDILYQACKNGMPNCTEAILQSAQKHKASIVECLMDRRHDGVSFKSPSSSQEQKESPLEVANRLFDMKSPQRLATLSICVQHASASRAETGDSDPTNYPLSVAAIGWVSPQICAEIFLRNNSSAEHVKAGKLGFVERCALRKAMYMIYDKPDFDQIPDIFRNQDLIQACRDKCPEEVHRILHKDKATKVISRKYDGENALDIAIKLYEENNDDEKSCEVLSICMKHVNTVKMNLQSSSSSSPEEYEYPTAFAAVGYVKKDVLHSIFRKFKHEIRTTVVGKVATVKLLYLGLGGRDYCNYANRLEKKFTFSMAGRRKQTRPKRSTNMETIYELNSAA